MSATEAAAQAEEPPGSGRGKLLSGSAIYLVSNVLNAAVPFALLPVLTRYLSPDEYGQVAMFTTLVAALAALTGANVHGAASRKYYDNEASEAEMGHFLGSCLQILAATTALLLVVSLAFREPLAAWLGLEPAWVSWGVIVSTASFVITLRLGQWQVRAQALRYGVLQISRSVVVAGASLVFVVVLLRGAEGQIAAQLWSVPLLALVALALLAKDGLVKVSWRPEYVREALAFGVPLIPHVGGLFLLNAVDRVVINDELGLAQAGIYMVAVQLTMAMTMVFDAFNKAYTPWLYERLRRDDPEEKRAIVRRTYQYFAAVLALAGLAFLIGPPIVTFVAGERFAEAGKIVGWLALGRAFGGMYFMVTGYVFYSKRTGRLSMASISSGLLNLLLLVALTSLWGLVGAALSFAVSMAVRFLLTWWVAQRATPMPWFGGR